MFSIDASDIIGVILLYLVVAILVASIVELINTFISHRARRLEQFLQALFLDSGLSVEEFYKLAIATPSLYRFTRPSYINSEDFSLALFAWLREPVHENTSAAAPQSKEADPPPLRLPEYTLKELKARTAALKDCPLRHTLAAIIVTAEHGQFEPPCDEAARLRTALEQWYERGLVRISGWYKRDTTVTILSVAFLIALMLNMDSIAIINNALQVTSLRAVIAAHAAINPAQTNVSTTTSGPAGSNTQGSAGIAQTGTVLNPVTTSSLMADIDAEMNQLKLPIGWADSDTQGQTTNWWAGKLLGILASAFALSQLAMIESALANRFR